jgi:3',5'-cyclic AMP phosphodiesterase CpdA
MSELLQRLMAELQSQLGSGGLGFCDPPKTRYIYANRQYPDCLWYFWNGGKNCHEPIEPHALTGVIEKIEIEEKDFRGKPDPKVNIYVNADRPYVIQSGIETLFTKGLIYTLSKLPIEAFKKPIMIAVEAGDTDSVLFSRVYNPATGAQVFAPYAEPVEWTAVIARAIDKVNQAHNGFNGGSDE